MGKREEYLPCNKFRTGETVMVPFLGGHAIGRVIDIDGKGVVTVSLHGKELDLPQETLVPYDDWAGNNITQIGKVVSLDGKVGVILGMHKDERLVYVRDDKKSGKFYWVDKDELKDSEIPDSWVINKSDEWLTDSGNGEIHNKDLERRLSSVNAFSPSNDDMMKTLTNVANTDNVTRELTNSDILDSLEKLLTDEDMSKQSNLSRAKDLVKELRKRI